MRRLACAVALLALACGDTPATGPEPLTVVADVSITSDPGDSVPPLTVFPDSLVVEVTNSSGDPIGGALVNFQSDPDGCVAPDVQSLQTNPDGEVFFQVTSGEDAITSVGPCTIRTVRSREGRADVADSLDVVVVPGELEYINFKVGKAEKDTLFYQPDWGPKDEWGNPVAWRFAADSFMHAAGVNPWTDAAKKLVWDSAGTANVRVLHNGSLLCTVLVEARSSGWVDKESHEHCT